MADLIFKINGADYPINDVGAFVNSLTIDECGVYHQWTGSLIEDIAEASVNSLMVAAFMQIAYMRGNPNINPQAARQAVGASNLADALSHFEAAAEDDAGPPEPALSEHEKNASRGATASAQSSSGTDSTPPSATPANGRNRSGSPPSVPSATLGSTRLDF